MPIDKLLALLFLSACVLLAIKPTMRLVAWTLGCLGKTMAFIMTAIDIVLILGYLAYLYNTMMPK